MLPAPQSPIPTQSDTGSRDARTSGIRELAPRQSAPPRPAPGSVTKATRRQASAPERRPMPPRPGASSPPPSIAVARSVPPPLPATRGPEPEPAWDANEETDPTEWVDVSKYAHVPSEPTHDAVDELTFRSGASARLVTWRNAASTFARTFALFGQYVGIDLVRWVTSFVPGARALAARLRVQWTRAAEHAGGCKR